MSKEGTCTGTALLHKSHKRGVMLAQPLTHRTAAKSVVLCPMGSVLFPSLTFSPFLSPVLQNLD